MNGSNRKSSGANPGRSRIRSASAARSGPRRQQPSGQSSEQRIRNVATAIKALRAKAAGSAKRARSAPPIKRQAETKARSVTAAPRNARSRAGPVTHTKIVSKPKTEIKLKSGAKFHPASATHNRKRRSTRRIDSAGNVVMEGHDFIGTLDIPVDAQQADEILQLPINPLALNFPALSIETQLHQQYLFSEFSLHMTNSASTFVNGTVLGWYDRDPDEALPPGVAGIQVGYYKNGKEHPFKTGGSWPMPRYPGLPVLYCRDINSDIRLVNQAAFNLQIITPPSVYNSGAASQVDLQIELWATYKCHFMVKDIAGVVGQGTDLVSCSTSSYTGSSSAPLGLGATNWVGNTEFKNFATIPGLFWTNVDGYDWLGCLHGWGSDDLVGLTAIFNTGGSSVDALVTTASNPFSTSDNTQGATVVGQIHGIQSTVANNLDTTVIFQIQVDDPGSIVAELGVGQQLTVVGPQYGSGSIEQITTTEPLAINWCVSIKGIAGSGYPTACSMQISPTGWATDQLSETRLPAFRYAGKDSLEGKLKAAYKQLSNDDKRRYKNMYNFVTQAKRAMKPQIDRDAKVREAVEDLTEAKGEMESKTESKLKGLSRFEPPSPSSSAEHVLVSTVPPTPPNSRARDEKKTSVKGTKP